MSVKALLLGVLALLATTLSANAQMEPAVASVWRPLSESQAKLIVSSRAFGFGSMQRQVNEAFGARYERAATQFDLSRRSYNIILRKSEPFVYVQDALDLRATAAELLGQRNPSSLVFGAGGSGTVGLGVADYLTFSFNGIACASFHITFGQMVQEYPASIVKGIYCDPAVATLPNYDVGMTLNAIGVRGIFQP